MKFTFLPSHYLIRKQESDKIVVIGKMVKNLYVLEIVVEKYFCNMFDPREMTISQWHIFLGHPSITTLKHMPVFLVSSQMQ